MRSKNRIFLLLFIAAALLLSACGATAAVPDARYAAVD